MVARSAFGQGWMPNRGEDYFPDPFLDYASTVMPRDITEAHRWCEYLIQNNGVYKSAIRRVISYFMTDVEIGGKDVGDDTKKKYEEFFKTTLKIKTVLSDIALNFITYGNTFSSLVIPFDRYLTCPKCGTEHPLRVVKKHSQFRFKWTNYEFHADCQATDTDGHKCGHKGKWRHIDRRRTSEKDIRVKIWPPQEIDIKHDEFSETKIYKWKIPDSYKRKIKEGHLHYLENANWEVIEAIRQGRDLEFDPGVIHHLFETPLAGAKTGGWGISSILANFRQAWYVQVLHRFNEAIAMDYVLPFRVITPAPGKSSNGEAADPVMGINVGSFMSRVRSMLRLRRKNPTEWFSLPYPIQYQVLGGEAKQLAPYELMDQGVSLLLNNIGVPAEMYKGSLTLQAAGPALRLFEQAWTHLVDGLNEFLCALCEQVAVALDLEVATAKLVSPTIVDDMQDQMAKLQLMMGKQISQTTGLKGMNLSFEEEQKRILDEERFVQEQSAKLQEEMDQAGAAEQLGAPPQQQPGQPGQPQPGQPADPNAPVGPAGGAAAGMQAAAPTGPNTSITPQELLEKAQVKAQEMLGLQEGQRQSAMTQLKQVDPTLHALVKQLIQDTRQQAQTAGGQQILQQQFGGQ